MKITEIQDRSKTLANLQAMHGPRPKCTVDYQKKIEATMRQTAFRMSKQDTERVAKQVAQTFRGDQFEQFKAEVVRRAPQAERYVNLAWAFDCFNPDRKSANSQSWDDYGNERINGPSGKYVGD